MKITNPDWHPYGEDADYGSYSIEIEVRNGNGELIGVLGDYVEGSIAFNSDASDVEASSITIPWSSPWAKTVMRANMRLILVHVIIYRNGVQILKRPWTGRVERAVRKMEGPQGSVTAELVSDKIFLKYLLAWSNPGGKLWLQAPKEAIYQGPVVHTLKRIASDNLLRLTGNQPLIGTSEVWMDRPAEWPTIHKKMPRVVVIPTQKSEDSSPKILTQVAMTPMDEVWQQACKDYNLLPRVSMYVPGRDEAPERLALSSPTIVLDIEDKDKARSRPESADRWKVATSDLGTFIRGLFGQFDVPPTLDVSDPLQLKDFFGHREEDPWVIFRDSPGHWASREVASYSPTASTTISGGKSQDFLNKGSQMVFNFLLNSALASVGLGFLGIDVGGFFDDVLFAYQRARDPNMRDFLGDFTLFEEFTGSGLTAYSFDAAQDLRTARYNSIGYQTAMFTGDMASFKPFLPFEDFDILDPVGWEDSIEDKMFTERVKQITVSFSRDQEISFEVRLGELDRPEEPDAIAQRRHESIIRAINTVTRR